MITQNNDEQLKLREENKNRTKSCIKCNHKFLSKNGEDVCLVCLED